jgi:hypothetical protein
MEHPATIMWPPKDTLSILVSFAILSAIYLIGPNLYNVLFGHFPNFQVRSLSLFRFAVTPYYLAGLFSLVLDL